MVLSLAFHASNRLLLLCTSSLLERAGKWRTEVMSLAILGCDLATHDSCEGILCSRCWSAASAWFFGWLLLNLETCAWSLWEEFSRLIAITMIKECSKCWCTLFHEYCLPAICEHKLLPDSSILQFRLRCLLLIDELKWKLEYLRKKLTLEHLEITVECLLLNVLFGTFCENLLL